MKSHIIQFILAFLFGPIGLLYSSIGWGLGMLIASIAFFMVNPALLLVIWFLCLFIGLGAVDDQNKRYVNAKMKEIKDNDYKQAILEKLDKISSKDEAEKLKKKINSPESEVLEH